MTWSGKKELSINFSGTSVDEYLRVVRSAGAISLVANYQLIIRAITGVSIPKLDLD
jgi:hypothetical protein